MVIKQKLVPLPAESISMEDPYIYLDDILALNNDGINIYTKDIHHIELSLNKANIDTKERLFLDLSIRIDDGKFNTKIYDKKEYFSFPIVNYPF